MKILNGRELDTWLFEHANNLGNSCVPIFENINDEFVNIAWRDTYTWETIDVVYGDDETNV